MEKVKELNYRNNRNNSSAFVEGESEIIETHGDMYQIRENDDELNNSFENLRKTFKKKPKSLDGFDEEEEGNTES